MKLLSEQRHELEDGEVKISMRPVTTAQQARLVELGSQGGLTARMELSAYCLKTCIEKISVSDVSYDPVRLASSANIGDEATIAVMIKLGEMVSNAAFAKDADLKK